MYQHEQLFALGEGFFDAAFEPSMWVELLEHVVHRLGVVRADLHLIKDDVLPCSYMGAQPAAFLQQYSEQFLASEPRCQALRGLCPGPLTSDHDVVDAQTMRSNPYDADFLPRAGLGQGIAATPVNDARRRAYFGLHLAASASTRNPALLTSVQAIQGRLSRAVSAQFRLIRRSSRTHNYPPVSISP